MGGLKVKHNVYTKMLQESIMRGPLTNSNLDWPFITNIEDWCPWFWEYHFMNPREGPFTETNILICISNQTSYKSNKSIFSYTNKQIKMKS